MAGFKEIKLQSLPRALKSLAALGTKVSLALFISLNFLYVFLIFLHVFLFFSSFIQFKK